MAKRQNKSSVCLADRRGPDVTSITSLKEEMCHMPIEEMYRLLLELEDQYPDKFATLQQACQSLDSISENEDPNVSLFVRSVRETMDKCAGQDKCRSSDLMSGLSAGGDASVGKKSSMLRKPPAVLLRFLYDSPREYRKCANDDDNMFSNYVDRVVYAMMPTTRSGKCGDCRFQRLTQAETIPELLSMVRKLKLTRRFCEEIITCLLDSIPDNERDRKDPKEAELLFRMSRDLLVKGNPTDALTRINRSLFKSKPQTQSYKFALRSVILNELNMTNEACMDWTTAIQYGFQRDSFLSLVGNSDVIRTKLDQVGQLSCVTKVPAKSDMLLYHNFPRPLQSGHLLPEATDRVEIVEQLSESGERKGCRLCACRKINAGDVILSEKSFGSVLTRNAISSRCFNCMIAVNKRFVPCSHCQLVKYCSETCRSQDWDTSHRQLCPLLDLLHYFPAGQAIIKLLIIHGVETVVRNSRKQRNLLMRPLSNDLQSFFAYRVTLSCSPWTRLNFSLTALFLTKMTFRFLDPGNVTETKLSAVILEMLLIMHETREALVEDVGKVRKRYGTFVSPIYRMLPICCQPNTLTQQLGDRTALIAAKKIEVGEEIRIH